MKQVYALLVGINDYAPEVGRLTGCLNDVAHFQDYLKVDLAPANLHVEILKDAAATRGNIIRLFRTHLARAGADDVALFHYSGHGARWASASAFREYYPDGRDEGLVCYDSRGPGGYDLADKELAVLISELAARDPHIAVIFDCCHSGSGTRGVDDFVHRKARQTHEVFEERPLESYLDGYYSRLLKAGDPLRIPRSRHILLAACERVQKAWETRQHSGVFTDGLLEVLQRSGGAISYSDLFVRCRSAVRERTDNQEPQFDAYERFNANAGFLGRPTEHSARRYSVSFDGEWQVACGALHGLPTDPQKSVYFALYPETDPENLAGHATTTRVGAQKSDLAGDFPDDVGTRFRAEVTSLPVWPIPVYARGDEAALAALARVLDEDRSAGIELARAPAGTRYEVRADDDRLLLLERESGALIQGAEGYSEYAAGKVLAALKDLAAYERGLTLQNYGTRMDTSLVDFWFTEILPDGREHRYCEVDEPGGEGSRVASEALADPLRHIRRVTVDFAKEGGEWRPIPGAFRARNRTDQTLHLALFYFSPNYGVYPVRNEPVPRGGEVTLWESEAGQGFYLPEGENEALDRWKLIVSTEKVDDFLLEIEDVKTGEIHPRPRTGARAVMGFGAAPRKKYEDEWFTKAVEVRAVRRIDRVGREDTPLAGGRVTVKGHPSVSANLSLTSACAGSRCAGAGSGIYEALERLPAPPGQRRPFELVELRGSRGTGAPQEASVLELTDVQNAETLAEHPLEIELDLPLTEHEGLLPVSFDGEHLLLGGDSFTDDDGLTHVRIDHLPDVPDNRRSLGKALKLYFFKTYLKHRVVNQLRRVELHDDRTVSFHDDDVAEKVAAAESVLLLIHGIIGDTDKIAGGLRGARDGTGRTIDASFDLVLAYDYESLSTPVEETAADLKRQLEAVGLKPGGGRRLTLLVHALGGLVSRWFIEQLDGHQVVDHLVMCGTPNGGSPLGHVGAVRQVFTTLTTVALNYSPPLAPYGSAVLFLLNRSQKLTPTLEQMNSGSELIAKLNAGAGPPIPYTVVAGDVDAFEEDSEGLLGRLLAKAGKGVLLESLFGTEHHDIAVSVESILGVPGAAEVGVACHHLNYFDADAGLEALAAISWRGGAQGAAS